MRINDKNRAQPPTRASLKYLREEKRRESPARSTHFYSERDLAGDVAETVLRAALEHRSAFHRRLSALSSLFRCRTGAQMLFEVTVTAIRRQLDGPIAKALLGGPYGILGWRHQLTAFVTPVIRRIGGDCDVEDLMPTRSACSAAFPTGGTASSGASFIRSGD